MNSEIGNNEKKYVKNDLNKFRTPFKRESNSTDVITRIDALIKRIDELLIQ
jgi:ribosome-associated translation inhibitor RaiA